MEHFRGKKILVYDDDPTYGMVMKRFAKTMDVFLVACQSFDEFCLHSLEGGFDVALIDFNLESFNGKTAAKVIEHCPTFLISHDDTVRNESADWPAVVKGFISKNQPPLKVIQDALGRVC